MVKESEAIIELVERKSTRMIIIINWKGQG